MYIDELEQLERTPGRLDKEALLRGLSPECLSLLSAALDPYKLYYVKRVPASKACESPIPAEHALRMFLEVLPKLQSRELTGKAAQTVIANFLTLLDPLTHKWLSRVLLKNPRIGVDAKTINKVWPGCIPTFDIMLAMDLPVNLTTRKVTGKVRYPVYCDYKLDGIRTVAVKRQGEVTMYSRSGHIIETLPEIAKSIEQLRIDNVVFDGEAMGASWNDTQSVLSSKKNAKDSEHMVYNIFDMIPLDVWDSHGESEPLEIRIDALHHLFAGIPDTSNLKNVVGRECLCEEDIWAFNEEALALGYEGSMIKDLNAPYPFKRSSACMKLKPKFTLEETITSWSYGEENSKWADGFGSFHIQTHIDGYPTADVSVGGGYTDKQRIEFFKNPDSYIGKIIEVEYQEVTKDGSLRFPVFVRFRSPLDRS